MEQPINFSNTKCSNLNQIENHENNQYQNFLKK